MEELSRKIENPESKALSNEARQPEAVKPSEKDKEKLVPKENESSKRNQENRDTREGDEPAHPKLEPKDANELKNNEDDELRQPEGGEPGTPEGNGKKLEVNGSGQPEAVSLGERGF